jgi:hypothetical protein
MHLYLHCFQIAPASPLTLPCISPLARCSIAELARQRSQRQSLDGGSSQGEGSFRAGVRSAAAWRSASSAAASAVAAICGHTQLHTALLPPAAAMVRLVCTEYSPPTCLLWAAGAAGKDGGPGGRQRPRRPDVLALALCAAAFATGGLVPLPWLPWGEQQQQQRQQQLDVLSLAELACAALEARWPWGTACCCLPLRQGRARWCARPQTAFACLPACLPDGTQTALYCCCRRGLGSA